jgi:hypothetical protein
MARNGGRWHFCTGNTGKNLAVIMMYREITIQAPPIMCRRKVVGIHMEVYKAIVALMSD